jgi:hypothetical protein
MKEVSNKRNKIENNLACMNFVIYKMTRCIIEKIASKPHGGKIEHLSRLTLKNKIKFLIYIHLVIARDFTFHGKFILRTSLQYYLFFRWHIR